MAACDPEQIFAPNAMREFYYSLNVRNHPRAPLLRASVCIARLAVNMRHDSRLGLG